MRRWLPIAQAALLAVAVAFIAVYLKRNWAAISAYDWDLAWAPLAGSLLLFLAFYVLNGLAWWLLLRQFGLPSSRLRATTTWGKSILARYIPGNVFMFLGRAVMSADQGLALEPVGAAMVYEQALGFVGALVAVAVLLPFWEFARWVTVTSLVAIPALVALLHPRVFAAIAGRLLRVLGRPPLAQGLSFPTVLLFLAYFVGLWLLAGLAAYLFLTGTTDAGADALPAVVAGYALAFVAGMVAFVFPSGAGVREAVMAAALASTLSGSVALAWAVLLRLWQTAVELLFVGAAVVVARVAPSFSRPAEGVALPAGRRRDGASAAAAPTAEALEVRRYGRYVVLAAVVAAILLTFLSLQLFRGFAGGRYDMGNMVQAVYNTAHGHFLEITTAEGRQMSRLGAHVDPILAAFALPWLLWPSPEMLLVAQAVIVALSAWPAYRLGVRILGNAEASALLAVALLLYPPLQFAVLNEFHAVTLVIPLLLFAFLYLEEGRPWRAMAFLVLAALCKEEVPLVIATMGVYFALRRRSWRPLVITALAVAYFAVAVFVIVPHFNVGGSPFVDRYADYGASAGEVAQGVFLQPATTLGDLFAGNNLDYLNKLLWPLLFLPLLSPLTLLIAAPEFLLNALSTQVFQRRIEFHYVAAEVPFLFAAAVLGLARLRRCLERSQTGRLRSLRLGDRVSLETLALAVLLGCLIANYVLGPLPFSLPGARMSGQAYAVSGHARVLAKAVDAIPDDAVVSTENNAGSHLSARRRVFVFPYVDDAAYVLVDQTKPFWFDKPDRNRHDEALGRLVLNTDYLSVFARDDVYIWKRVKGQPAP